MASSTVRPDNEGHDIAARLLLSAARLSYDPAAEVDWDTPSTRTSTARARSGTASTGPPTGTR